MNYHLYDFYENSIEDLGGYDTIEEATVAAREREEETDGECDLCLTHGELTQNERDEYEFDEVKDWRY